MTANIQLQLPHPASYTLLDFQLAQKWWFATDDRNFKTRRILSTRILRVCVFAARHKSLAIKKWT